jgi:L-alanine-DL-glutamate epimerase-like enolase superfamily enzyme
MNISSSARTRWRSSVTGAFSTTLVSIEALRPLDLALWDLAGKIIEQP